MSGPEGRRVSPKQIEAAKREIRAGWTAAQRRSSIVDYEQAVIIAIEDAMDGMQNAVEFLRTNVPEYMPNETTKGDTDPVWLHANSL